MKNIAILLIFTAILSGACSKKGFHIKGLISGMPENAVITLYDSHSHKEIDSTVVMNGKFEFKGTVQEISNYYLIYEPADQEAKYLTIWIDNIKITINGEVGDFENAEIKGTEVQLQQKELTILLNPINSKIDSIYSVYNEEDTAAARILGNLYDSLLIQETAIQSDFIEQHPDYFFSVFILNRLIRELDVEKGQKLFSDIAEDLKSSTYAKSIEKYLELNKNLKIGDKFADLTLTNTSGQTIALSSVNTSKYTLIDFWASWCNPCRKENPNLLKAYNSYKEKGFEIYGISLDENLSDWKKALAEDSISWISVIDTNAFDSDAAMMYSVRYIPHNFLLDTNGIILAIDLRGEELERKLIEVFKN